MRRSSAVFVQRTRRSRIIKLHKVCREDHQGNNKNSTMKNCALDRNIFLTDYQIMFHKYEINEICVCVIDEQRFLLCNHCRCAVLNCLAPPTSSPALYSGIFKGRWCCFYKKKRFFGRGKHVIDGKQ